MPVHKPSVDHPTTVIQAGIDAEAAAEKKKKEKEGIPRWKFKYSKGLKIAGCDC